MSRRRCLGRWQFAEQTGHLPKVSDKATLNDILVEVGLGDSQDSEEDGADLLWEQLVAISGLKYDPSLAQLVRVLSANMDALKAGLVKHGMQLREARRLCEKIRVLSQGIRDKEAQQSPLHAVLTAFSTTSSFFGRTASGKSSGTIGNPFLGSPSIVNSAAKGGTFMGEDRRHAKGTPHRRLQSPRNDR